MEPLGDAGFSNAPWTSNQTTDAVSWSSETFAQNQNANAIRWGTLYNFRFDSNKPPIATNATIGFFKTGTPVTVAILGPNACDVIPTPTPTPTPTPATPTPTPTPCSAIVFAENFDGVVAPALPPGWSGAGDWVTSTTTPDTAPNDAFVDDPDFVSDKSLDSRNLIISSGVAQVSFRNSYDLETGFDGGVLEISSPNINAGAFTDVTDPAVGGSFISGGYNSTIASTAGSPIAGRQAWSGNSGGYLNTVVRLGPNVDGQTIRLRFRMVSDVFVPGVGWRIDTVTSVGVCMGPIPTPNPNTNTYSQRLLRPRRRRPSTFRLVCESKRRQCWYRRLHHLGNTAKDGDCSWNWAFAADPWRAGRSSYRSSRFLRPASR